LSVKFISGNEAIAYGSLLAGVKVVAGYPGTPSSEVITSLQKMNHQDVYVEWSTNEKVAFEVAAAASWAGQRALCTMKMSGLNVAYDSLASVAYSGVNGALVVYVADDPGVSAGMCEQDSRGFALMSDLPVIEPASVEEAYGLTQFAFELSEQTGTPVFLRMVTATAQSYAGIEVDVPPVHPNREPELVKDIAKYTKAGSQICIDQHHDVIARLAKAGEVIRAKGINSLTLSDQPGGLGIIAAGPVYPYLEEGLRMLVEHGLSPDNISTLKVTATVPFPAEETRQLLSHCAAVLVLEELEPHLEKDLYVEARKAGFKGKITGKIEGPLSRVGDYSAEHAAIGIAAAAGFELPADMFGAVIKGEQIAAARPITTCAGCPHRGTFLAINKAIKELKYKKDDVMVTGDIGCTILGMNPPFNTVWTEISMGSSIGFAQGYYHSGVKTPIIATIGDSTFFHAGMPSLINAVQHQVPLTLIIMDNGWTSMTGMQVSPGTDEKFQQQGNRRLDLVKIIPALGVDHFSVINPFDYEESTAAIREAMTMPGVKVILARQECAIQAMRQGKRYGKSMVIEDNCNKCKLCITVTGCPAISLGEESIIIDPALCYGCGLCSQVCNREAIERGPVENAV
jgi:indolepyruvate ferredoxin oxidoreductase alpha subunit